MTTAKELLALLDGLDIETRTYEHPPLRTVAESKALRGDLPGAHCKSLFLTDKRGTLWLVVALESRRIDLKDLRRRLGASGGLSFARPDRLRDLLGVSPGAVTPFAVVNDREGRVTVVLDEGLLSIAPLNFHPLRNDRTTAISPDDLLRFLDHCGHPPVRLPL